MITKVFKYPLDMRADVIEIRMPRESQILALQTQGPNGNPCIWARVNPESKDWVRKFRIYGTGRAIDSKENAFYIGTFQTNSGAFIWHVFELLENSP